MGANLSAKALTVENSPLPKSVEARDLKSWLSDGAEIALFDVREAKPYSEGHPFFAVPLQMAPIRRLRRNDPAPLLSSG